MRTRRAAVRSPLLNRNEVKRSTTDSNLTGIESQSLAQSQQPAFYSHFEPLSNINALSPAIEATVSEFSSGRVKIFSRRTLYDNHTERRQLRDPLLFPNPIENPNFVDIISQSLTAAQPQRSSFNPHLTQSTNFKCS